MFSYSNDDRRRYRFCHWKLKISIFDFVLRAFIVSLKSCRFLIVSWNIYSINKVVWLSLYERSYSLRFCEKWDTQVEIFRWIWLWVDVIWLDSIKQSNHVKTPQFPAWVSDLHVSLSPNVIVIDHNSYHSRLISHLHIKKLWLEIIETNLLHFSVYSTPHKSNTNNMTTTLKCGKVFPTTNP